jgi:hypothetical protein
MAAVAARTSCSISFIHSSLVWCCTMNSIVMGGRQRVLGRENLVQMQIVAIAHVTAEVELGFLVADDGGAAMHRAAGGFIRHGQVIVDGQVRAA